MFQFQVFIFKQLLLKLAKSLEKGKREREKVSFKVLIVSEELGTFYLNSHFICTCFIFSIIPSQLYYLLSYFFRVEDFVDK